MLTIVGNGPSRKRFDLDQLENWWGCNYIYSESIPDILWSMDMIHQVELFSDLEYYKENKVAVGFWEPMEVEYLESIQVGLGCGTSVVHNHVDKENHDRFVVMGNDSSVDLVGYSTSHQDNIVIYNFPLLKNLFTGMAALGYAMETGVKEVTLLGFDALQYGDVSNVYSGAHDAYAPKYTEEDKVFTIQRLQFIALLKHFKDTKVYFKNSLDELELIEYNKLSYYESSDEWVLGEGSLKVPLNKIAI